MTTLLVVWAYREPYLCGGYSMDTRLSFRDLFPDQPSTLGLEDNHQMFLYRDDNKVLWLRFNSDGHSRMIPLADANESNIQFEWDHKQWARPEWVNPVFRINDGAAEKLIKLNVY